MAEIIFFSPSERSVNEIRALLIGKKGWEWTKLTHQYVSETPFMTFYYRDSLFF